MAAVPPLDGSGARRPPRPPDHSALLSAAAAAAAAGGGSEERKPLYSVALQECAALKNEGILTAEECAQIKALLLENRPGVEQGVRTARADGGAGLKALLARSHFREQSSSSSSSGLRAMGLAPAFAQLTVSTGQEWASAQPKRDRTPSHMDMGASPQHARSRHGPTPTHFKTGAGAAGNATAAAAAAAASALVGLGTATMGGMATSAAGAADADGDDSMFDAGEDDGDDGEDDDEDQDDEEAAVVSIGRPKPVAPKPSTPGRNRDRDRGRTEPRKWSTEEDLALQRAVETHGEQNWKAIATLVPGRNHVQCLQRWKKVLRPGLVKGHWTGDEDESLRQLVGRGYKSWTQIAEVVPGRTAKQCRERWCNHLDPRIKKGGWTSLEDQALLEAQGFLGKKWAQISKFIPGRTENAVKIRWKSFTKRAASRGQEVNALVQDALRNIAAQSATPATPSEYPLVPKWALPTGTSADRFSPFPLNGGSAIECVPFIPTLGDKTLPPGCAIVRLAREYAQSFGQLSLAGPAPAGAGNGAAAGAPAVVMAPPPPPSVSHGMHMPHPGAHAAAVSMTPSPMPGMAQGMPMGPPTSVARPSSFSSLPVGPFGHQDHGYVMNPAAYGYPGMDYMGYSHDGDVGMAPLAMMTEHGYPAGGDHWMDMGFDPRTLPTGFEMPSPAHRSLAFTPAKMSLPPFWEAPPHPMTMSHHQMHQAALAAAAANSASEAAGRMPPNAHHQ